MKYLRLEDNRLLNVELISIVEPHPRSKTASVWDGGVNVVSESSVVYRFFYEHEHGLLEGFEAEVVQPVQSAPVDAAPPQEQ